MGYKIENEDDGVLEDIETSEENPALSDPGRTDSNQGALLQQTRDAARQVLAAYERLEEQYARAVNRNASLEKINITLFWMAMLQKDGSREYRA